MHEMSEEIWSALQSQQNKLKLIEAYSQTLYL